MSQITHLNSQEKESELAERTKAQKEIGKKFLELNKVDIANRYRMRQEYKSPPEAVKKYTPRHCFLILIRSSNKAYIYLVSQKRFVYFFPRSRNIPTLQR
jgi:hypothetical protein